MGELPEAGAVREDREDVRAAVGGSLAEGDTSVRGPRVRRQDRRDRRQGEGRGKADGQRDGAPAEHGSDPSPEGPGDKGRLRAVRTDDARRCPARSISADPDPYREILPPAI